MWRDVARCGEIWRDVGVRTRMASAAPSMGLRRDHIGFRQFVRNFRQKCQKMHFWRFSIDFRYTFDRLFDRCSIDFR